MVCRAIRRTAQSRAARRTPAARVGLHQTLATSRETVHTIPKCSGTHAPNLTHAKAWLTSGDVRPPQLPRHRTTRCRAPRASSCPEGNSTKTRRSPAASQEESEAGRRCASLSALASRCLPRSAPGKSSRELEGGKNCLPIRPGAQERALYRDSHGPPAQKDDARPVAKKRPIRREGASVQTRSQLRETHTLSLGERRQLGESVVRR